MVMTVNTHNAWEPKQRNHEFRAPQDYMERPFPKRTKQKDRAGKVAQRGKKGVSVKAEDLGLLFRTHVMEEESHCLGLFSDLYSVLWHEHAHTVNECKI